MRTPDSAAAMATVLAVPAAAKTLLKNPQRLLPDYESAADVTGIPGPHIDYEPRTTTRRNRSAG
jgi:hypothetical protein